MQSLLRRHRSDVRLERGLVQKEDALTLRGARRPGEADGVAGGGMPRAYKGDRTWPMAETMMWRQTLGATVTDSNLLGTPEGSLALPRMWGSQLSWLSHSFES